MFHIWCQDVRLLEHGSSGIISNNLRISAGEVLRFFVPIVPVSSFGFPGMFSLQAVSSPRGLRFDPSLMSDPAALYPKKDGHLVSE